MKNMLIESAAAFLGGKLNEEEEVSEVIGLEDETLGDEEVTEEGSDLDLTQRVEALEARIAQLEALLADCCEEGDEDLEDDEDIDMDDALEDIDDEDIEEDEDLVDVDDIDEVDEDDLEDED